MIKNNKITFIIYVIAFVVIWNVIDLIIYRANFHFAVRNIVYPLIIGSIVGYFLYIHKSEGGKTNAEIINERKIAKEEAKKKKNENN